MDAPTPVHPTDQTLSSFGLGKLDDGPAEAVNKHLEQCPDCRKRVAEMSADSFLGRIRDAQKGLGVSAPAASPAGGTQTYKGSMTPPPADTLPPGLADHPDYEIKKELGRGGMGVVYLAHNKLMGRDEVLKVMGRHIMERPGVLDRFLREIRAVARLRHANIVTAYSAVRVGESIVFAMEFVDGLDLARMVKAKGPLPVSHACNFVYQSALGLQHAHEEGLVHRDIKPGNLMLAKKGSKATVKVLDFGLAKATREEQVDSALTSQGQALGTPDFIAPEQILDAPNVDIRADIYSLGATLYYLLTGRPPFKAKALYDVYQAHISRDADPLNLVRPEVPAELAALVAKMMAKDPARRFQTPGEVAAALSPFFKTGSAAFKSPRTDVSQIGPADVVRPVSEAVSTPTQSATGAGGTDVRAKKATEPTASESRWERLIDLREEKSSVEAAPAVAPRRRPPWASWPMIVAASVLGAFLLGVIIYVARDKGRIRIVVDGPRPIVTIDGETVRIQGLDQPITLRAGTHELEVKWGDGEFKTRRPFVVRRGNTEELRVEYEPKKRPDKPPSQPSAPKAESIGSGSKDDGAKAWSRLMAKLGRQSSGPAPYACWTFESDARDEIGSLHGTLLGGAAVREGRLYLDGKSGHMRTEPLSQDIREKTLEAWVLLHNLDQRGGDVFSIEYGSTFDAILFGEREPRKWIAGSEWFRRTVNLVAPAENARSTDLIHMAIVYDADGGITVYREGRRYAERYVPKGRQATLRTYPAGDSHVLLGQRLTGAGNGFLTGAIEEAEPGARHRRTSRAGNGFLTGAIEEARLYDRALTADEVAASYRAGVIHYTTAGGTGGLPTSATPGPDQSPAGKPPAPATARAKPADTARPDPSLKTWTNSLGMKFVRIEPGKFGMGSTEKAEEQPPHLVEITRPFSLGDREVTQRQYQAVMGVNPSQFKGSDDLPVEKVSWLDAVTFCNKLGAKEGRTPCYRIDGKEVTVVAGNGYRLPTEAEWEYACRAGSTTRFPFGDNEAELGESAWYQWNAEGKTHPAGQKRPNRWGLYDMLGNVWEWCQDGYDAGYYATSIPADPPGPSGASSRVVRGGSWYGPPARCRPAFRRRGAPGSRSHDLGFRLAAAGGTVGLSTSAPESPPRAVVANPPVPPAVIESKPPVPPAGVDLRRLKSRPGELRLLDKGADLPRGPFWPEIGPDNVREWRIGDPSAIKMSSQGIVLSAGPGGNFLLTRSDDFKKCSLRIEFEAGDVTEAYLALRAREGPDGWHAVTSRIDVEKGRVHVGHQGFDFEAQESGLGRRPDYGTGTLILIGFETTAKGIGLAHVRGVNTASANLDVGPAAGWTGAGGVFVRSGKLLIHSITVR
jgi:formylglycine-generating enzyme required for sulfatase activity/serine/threonine protein kinase